MAGQAFPSRALFHIGALFRFDFLSDYAQQIVSRGKLPEPLQISSQRREDTKVIREADAREHQKSVHGYQISSRRREDTRLGTSLATA